MPELNASDVVQLYNELRGLSAKRNADYALARRWYRGEHWDGQNLVAVKGRYSLTANYLRPAVKNGVRDLFGRMPGLQVFPEGPEEEARRRAEGAEGVLYRCYEENDAPKVFRRAAHNQVLLRRGILYVWVDPEPKRIRFRSVDPANFYALKDGEQIVECILASRRLTSELRRQHPGVRPDESFDASDGHGVSGVRDGITDALGDDGSADPTRRAQGEYTTVLDYYHRDGSWVRVASDKRLASGKLGYGLDSVPFIEVENDFLGDESEPESEVPPDVVELNQYFDQLISQQADIIRKYANPTIVDQGSGVDPAKIRMIVQGEAGVLPIRKDGQVRYLNWEGPQPAIGEQREAIKAMLHDLGGRPAVAFGEAVTNQSGVMTNLAMNPTVAVAQDRQALWGMAMVRLNSWILRLYEKFFPTEDLSYRGYVPSVKGGSVRMRLLDTTAFGAAGVGFRGRDLQGWYRNQIKWPSVLRTDDPLYVQTVLSQVTSDPPTLSVYDAIEMLGHDDAEGIADRIGAQLEDPRFHPDRLQGAIEAANALGAGPGGEAIMGMGPGDGSGMGTAAQSAGNPHRDALAEG